MKVYFNKYNAWLQSKGKDIQAVLLFGSDQTTLDYCQEETIEYIKKHHGNVCLSRYTQAQILDTPNLLLAESALDLFNTHFPVIILEDCSDKIAPLVSKIASFSSAAFFIFKGFGLRTTAKIVRYFEDSSTLGCVGCYVPDHDYIRAVVQRKFLSRNRIIHQNALELLIQKYDFQDVISLVEKLFLYKPSEAPITQQDIEQFISQEPTFHLEVFIEKLLNRLPSLGYSITSDFLSENYLTIIRTMVYRLKRLLIVLENLQQGQSLEKALSLLTPSLLFFQKDSFCQQLKKWTVPEILNRLGNLYQAELLFKKGFSGTAVEKELLNIF